jgi:CheY-like chemotaxis protein
MLTPKFGAIDEALTEFAANQGSLRNLLAHAQGDLSAADMQSARVLGGFAHEFNNLLVPITGALELAQLALPPEHSVRALLRDGLDAALRARQLTQRIVSFARHGIDGDAAAVAPPPALRDPAPQGSVAEPNSSEAHILCVDDESVVLSVTKRALETAGYLVHATSHPAEALQWIKASCSSELQAFDVLITDFRMPQQSGLELARRAREYVPDLPVIMVTGFAEGMPETGAARGVSAHLQKPYRVSELTQCVERCLAARREQAARACSP